MQGKYIEAEPKYHQTLTLTEKLLGKEHPATLNSMKYLAVLLNIQNRYGEAEQLRLLV